MAAHGVADNYRLHIVPNDRVWLRDSAPTVVRRDDGKNALVNWRFNAWAKYPNYARDACVGEAVERITGLERIEPVRPDNGERVVLEGGAIETDGQGTAARDRGMPAVGDSGAESRPDARRLRIGVSQSALGIRQTIWLGEGCVGDDTHGHVDDIARFAAPGVIVLAVRGGSGGRRESSALRRQPRTPGTRRAAMPALYGSSSFPTRAPSR